jgi:hypothetical protein
LKGEFFKVCWDAPDSGWSGRFHYPTGTQTTGAYLDIFYLTVLYRPHPAEIWQPTPFRFVVGVGNIITDLRPFAAHFTETSHKNRLLKFLKK